MNYTTNTVYSMISTIEPFLTSNDQQANQIEFSTIFNRISSYSFYFVIGIMVCLVGVIGNMMVMVSILTSKDLRQNPTCVLCFNIALSDFLMSIFVNGYGKIANLSFIIGARLVDSNLTICKLFSTFCMLSCGSSMITMAILSINRYIFIFYNLFYKFIFSIYLTIFMCVFSWMLAFTLDLENILDIINNHWTSSAKAGPFDCIFDHVKSTRKLAYLFGCIILPMITILVCYFRIFWHAYKIKSRLMSKTNLEDKRKLESIKLAKSLLLTFVLFVVCWIPTGILGLFDLNSKLTVDLSVFLNTPIHINSALNPIFYFFYNPLIRKGYKRLLSTES